MMLRISALAIALVTAAGLYKKAWLPAKKCIRAGFFVYYTHLSNLLVLGVPAGRWASPATTRPAACSAGSAHR